MEPSIQQGASMAAIGLAGTIAGLLFGYLRDRDKIHSDSRLTLLESAVAACEEKHKDCETAHADTVAKLDAAVAQLNAHDARDRADMQAQIDALRKQLAQKKDRTDGHDPIG